MAFCGAPARVREPCVQIRIADVHRRWLRGVRTVDEPFPFAARLIEGFQGVLSAERFHALAQFVLRRTQVGTAFFGRTPLGLCLIESLDGAVRLRDECAEPRIRLGIDRERS